MYDADIKDVWKRFLESFHKRNRMQKTLWLLYGAIFVYLIITGRITSYGLSAFLTISLPICFLVDWLLRSHVGRN